MYISEIVTTPPENVSERVPLEQEVYKVFKKLGISYERVDNDPGIFNGRVCRYREGFSGSGKKRRVFV